MPILHHYHKLLELLGAEVVSIAAEDLQAHGGDKWFASREPEIVITAQCSTDVSVAMKYCAEAKIPVTPRGAGIGYVGGCVPTTGGVVISVAKMKRILEISPEDGVAVVEPGVTTGDLQAAAAALGWFYPPDPASLKECSIGGNVATNAGGPRCVKYGVTRHYVLGLEVVLPEGQILRTGSRCHKNRTGFDLVGLFTGSEGMLGIITEVTLRLIPMPPARQMLSAGFASFGAAAAAVQAIFAAGFLPSALEIADPFTIKAARNYKGADLIPAGEAHLLVELDGRKQAVQADMMDLAELVRSLNPASLSVAETEAGCQAVWNLRREFSYSLRATGLIKLNEDIVVPRSRLVDLVNFCQRLQEDSGLPIASFGHAGDGNIHVNIMVASMADAEQRGRAEAALDRLFRQVLEWGGVVSGEHGIGLAKSKWFAKACGEVSFDLHQRIKNALDPSRMLNPGKFLDPIEAAATLATLKFENKHG